MSHHPYQRGPHSRTMSSEERSSIQLNKNSTPVHKSASSSSSSQRDSRQESDSWEIIEGLKIGQSHVQRPDKHEGFMLKKRKWPLKGWHKRFFVLDNGILKYSKSPIDIFISVKNVNGSFLYWILLWSTARGVTMSHHFQRLVSTMPMPEAEDPQRGFCKHF